jgi:hypothetical protein
LQRPLGGLLAFVAVADGDGLLEEASGDLLGAFDDLAAGVVPPPSAVPHEPGAPWSDVAELGAVGGDEAVGVADVGVADVLGRFVAGFEWLPRDVVGWLVAAGDGVERWDVAEFAHGVLAVSW